MSIEVSTSLLDKLIQLVVEQAVLLYLCSGRSHGADEAVSTHTALVTIPLDALSFTVLGDGRAVIKDVNGMVKTGGRLTHFVVASAGPTALLTGAIGVKTGELQLRRVDVLPGDRVEIERLEIVAKR